MENKSRSNPDTRPGLRVERQPNGTPVVRAVTEADIRTALMAGIDFTLDPLKTVKSQNGTHVATPGTDSEVAAAVLSGLNYSLPGPKRTGR